MVDKIIKKRMEAMKKNGFKLVSTKDLGNGETRYFYEKKIIYPVNCQKCKHYLYSNIGKKSIHRCGKFGNYSTNLNELKQNCHEEVKIIKKEVNDFNPFYFDDPWYKSEVRIINDRNDDILMYFSPLKEQEFYDEPKKPNPKNYEIYDIMIDFKNFMNKYWRKEHK